jgi:hypothetical protein
VSTASLPAPVARPGSDLARYSVADVEVMADRVVRSRLFPGVDTPQAAFTLMMLCQSEGLHPMQALKRYHLIEGRPSMRADAMQAEFLARGGWIRWEQYDAEAAVATFGHRQHCPDGLRLAVSFLDLDKAGVTRTSQGLKKNWKQFPGAMLRARLISMGVRMIDPGVVVGIYTPEEVADFDHLSPEAEAARDAPPQSPPAHPQNHSGHGRGQYASPEQIAEYRRRLGKVIDQANAAWLDGWANRTRGEVPAGSSGAPKRSSARIPSGPGTRNPRRKTRRRSRPSCPTAANARCGRMRRGREPSRTGRRAPESAENAVRGEAGPERFGAAGRRDSSSPGLARTQVGTFITV